jgi:hypothetical protein
MLIRERRPFAALLVLACLLPIQWRQSAVAAERVAAARDWQQSPAIIELNTDGPVVAVGDVHGDYKRLVNLLQKAGIVSDAAPDPTALEWKAGKTILICTGDLIDKGKHSLDVIRCFRLLQQKSQAAGGRTIVTMGNHEAEFLAHPTDDEKAEEFLAELEAEHLDPQTVASGKDDREIGAFMRGLPFAVRINDWFFAHACDTQGKTMATLERELRDSVDSDGFGADILVAKHGLLEARLKPLPWWERERDRAADSERRLRGYADALGIKHFVMGHQPGKATFSDGSKRKGGELVEKFDGLIFLIDVGMSSAIDKSEGAALRIEQLSGKQTATVIKANGSQDVIWKSSQ